MILTETKALVTRIESHYTTLTLKYRYSTAQEWINELTQLSSKSDISKMYPFLFINSVKVTESGETDRMVTIGELVLATLSNTVWTAEQRKLKNFDLWLSPLYDHLIEAMQLSRYFSLVSIGTRTDHLFYGKQGLYGGEGNVFHDRIDAIEINNIKLRLYKTCTNGN
jgi:hypothetical protein